MKVDEKDPAIAQFLEFARSYCKRNGKSFQVRNAGKLRIDGGMCAGWCDGDSLAVAGRHHLAMETLVHEFSHMRQAVERSPLWVDMKHDYVEALAGLKKGKPVMWCFSGLYESILVERDCERRSLAMIRKFGLPIDTEQYAKMANLYLHYYHYVFLRRKWIDSTTIYKPELLDVMSSKLVTAKSLRRIDMDMMEKFEKFLA